jgi:hypothetical protein
MTKTARALVCAVFALLPACSGAVSEPEPLPWRHPIAATPSAPDAGSLATLPEPAPLPAAAPDAGTPPAVNLPEPEPAQPDPVPATDDDSGNLPEPAPVADAGAPAPTVAFGRAIISVAWTDQRIVQLQCIDEADCRACRDALRADGVAGYGCTYPGCDDSSECSAGLECRPTSSDASARTVCRVPRADLDEDCEVDADCEPGLACQPLFRQWNSCRPLCERLGVC